MVKQSNVRSKITFSKVVKIFTSALLAVVLACSCLTILAGCSKKTGTDQELTVYLSSMPKNFDPAFAALESSGAQFIPMLYEGLFTYDENGKVVPSAVKSYRFYIDKNTGEEKLEMTLRENKYNDGNAVNANDFKWTFRRALETYSNLQCANLLYFIKNAKDYNNGTGVGKSSPDDLGIETPTKTSRDETVQILTLTLEPGTAYTHEMILANLASPELSCVKASKSTALSDSDEPLGYDWATFAITMCFNGPYYVKSFVADKSIVLQRNVYYVEKNPKKAVTMPKTINIYAYDASQWENGKLKPGEVVLPGDELNLNWFNSGKLSLDSYFPVNPTSGRTAISGASVASTTNLLSLVFNLRDVYDYRDVYVNEDKKTEAPIIVKKGWVSDVPFPTIVTNDAVRAALSLAIDRTALADALVYAKAAEGLIPSKLPDIVGATGKNAKTFREVGGSLLASTADVAAADKKLQDVGFKGGTLTLGINSGDSVSRYMANKLKEAWESLVCANGGKINVAIVELGVRPYTVQTYEKSILHDLYIDAITKGADTVYKTASYTKEGNETEVIEMDYVGGLKRIDVFLCDIFSSTTDAFNTLSVYDASFSGVGYSVDEVMDLDPTQDYIPKVHYSGYDSAEFNALIEEAYAQKDAAKRAEALHKAEKLLLGDNVVVPLVETQTAYVQSASLTGLKVGYFGNMDLRYIYDKNYVAKED